MALRAYPARTLSGSRPAVQRYTLKASETFKRGDPVTIDSNEDVLIVSGTDPASILGFAAEDAADVIESGYVVVWLADGNTVFAMSGDNDPTADDVNQSYGIVDDGNGVWTVDGTDTSATRLYVLDVDIDSKLYFCYVLDANRVVKA